MIQTKYFCPLKVYKLLKGYSLKFYYYKDILSFDT